MAMSIPRIRPDTALEAAGYVRVSRKVQADGHSPEIQREAMKRLARQEGYILTDAMIEEDHERGSKVSREGYQRVIQAVREGRAGAVIVYMFDRWGRDGAEWLTRAREFDRLGVPIISVQEGKDEGGLMRFVRAGMAQHYSEQLAKRVLPAREKAAREGTYMGPTPLGYRRVYPAHEGKGLRPAGRLVVDEATAWIVREMFTRYAAGGWSIRSLVGWLNTDERVRLATTRERWTTSSIKSVLHNPAYIGMVRYNRRPCGYYERAAQDGLFVVQGRHEGLVDAETFETVQRRLAAATCRQSYNRHYDAPVLGAALFRCAGCGGPMHIARQSDGQTHYKCGWRRTGYDATTCTTRGYLAARAHDALVREVSRLRGAPWTPQAEQRLAGGDDDGSGADRAAGLHQTLTAERDRLRRHTRLMSEMDDDPTPEQIAIFREISGEISATIRALEAQVAEVGHRAARVPALREVHARLTGAEVPAVLARLDALGGVEQQRALVQSLITEARVVERLPESHPTWVRVAVTWSADVQTLLDAGLLTLDDAPAGPVLPTKQEQARAYCRRYRERHRAEIQARQRDARARQKQIQV